MGMATNSRLERPLDMRKNPRILTERVDSDAHFPNVSDDRTERFTPVGTAVRARVADGRPLVVRMKWLRHTACGWSHEQIRRHDGRIYLQCSQCGYQSPGFSV
jgi:hypothetical protein